MNRYFEINEEGHNIRCKLYCTEAAAIRKAVIFGHGFAGHKDNKAAERFAEKVLSRYKNAAVITFDWPCHGDDVKKKMTLQDCDTYLRLLLGYVRRRYGTEQFYAYGTSFGGYMFLRYIRKYQNPFQKIALRCPAVNMYESLKNRVMRGEDYEKILKGKDALVGFDRKVNVGMAFLKELEDEDIRKMDFLDFADDILILHGTKDEVIPFEVSRDFAEENVIELIPIENADHRFQNLLHMDLATKYVTEFFFKS